MTVLKIKVIRKTKGGPGSGNWGHRGRPGLIGGSAPAGRSSSVTSATTKAEQARLRLLEIDHIYDRKLAAMMKRSFKLSHDYMDALQRRDRLVAKTSQIDRIFGEAGREIYKLTQEVDAIYDEKWDLDKAIDTFSEERMKALHDSLATNGVLYPTKYVNMIQARYGQEYADNLHEEIATGVAFVDSHSWVSTHGTIEFRESEDGRAGCDGSTIYLGHFDTARAVVHELGHHIEYTNPTIHAKVRAFYERRTAGEAAKPLNDVANSTSYRPSEMTKPDNFINPYMGKEYGWATEILSMGLEYFYSEPVKLATQDPEYFNFIYNILRYGEYEYEV